MEASQVAQVLALVCVLVLVCAVVAVLPFGKRTRSRAGDVPESARPRLPRASVWEAPFRSQVERIQSDSGRGRALPQDLEDVRVRVTRAFARLERRTESHVWLDRVTTSMAGESAAHEREQQSQFASDSRTLIET